MLCLITTLMKSAIKKTTRKKPTTKWAKTTISRPGSISKTKSTQTSNNVKMQSDKAFTTPIYFFLALQKIETFFNETR